MTEQEAQEYARQYFNKVGLYAGYDPVRIIGFNNGQEDYYFIALNHRGEKCYQSMVGGFDPIEGEYTYRIWDFNIPPVDEFLVEIDPEWTDG